MTPLKIMAAVLTFILSPSAALAKAGPPVGVEGGVLFTLEKPGAREVYLAGEFNNWSPTADLMEKDEAGVWSIVMEIGPGRYEYKYVVDGVWEEDPLNDMTVPDPYGGKNSVVVVGEEVVIEVEEPGAREVYLAGEFNSWSPTADLMEKGKDGVWRIVLPLGSGRYEYKFVIDGVWQEDPENPDTVPDPYGGKNSVLTVGEGAAPPSPKTATGRAAVAVTTGKPGPPAAVDGGILFTFEAPAASEVYLAGEFNGWSPTADPMAQGDDGIWRIVLPLDPGRYEYKFVVDGAWKEDPDNPDVVPDPYGGNNSVVSVGEDGQVTAGAPPPRPAAAKGPVVSTLKSKGKPIYVALLWHQHQPKYMKDPATGEYAEPWVRIHAIKDYYDMTAVLGQYPEMKFTVNLTPVLLMQLKEVIEGYHRWRLLRTQYMPGADRWIRLTLTPPDRLTYDEKAYILRNFFRMPWDTMLNIYPRFKELASKKLGDSDDQIDATIRQYTDEDWRDLQAWFNLAEFDPDFKEGKVTLPSGRRVGVERFIQKERGFTEEDKREIIEIQMEILRAVVEVHRKYQDEGRLEVITTPFYHPILPLICDTDLARVAMPGVPLPEPAYRWPDDAAAHLRMAQENYRENFGRPAEGLWAAEGSVAEDIVPLVADAGFLWMASDEEVLAASLKGRAFGDQDKYRAWWAEKDGKKVAILFRDRAISDAIGFNYSKMDGVDAANDLMQRLHRIHQEFATRPGTYVVPIILDGENAWEHYPRDGKDFFHSMYSQMTGASWLVPVTIADFLEKHPPEETIDVLWPGSWIAHNFATWIGEPEENEAWSLLAETRFALEAYRKSPGADPVAVGKAFAEMYAAEGSDWFWWYGKDQSSGNDEFFDEAFRSALRNVYKAMGQEPPAKLWTPIVMTAAATPERQVSGPFTPVVDGEISPGEWAGAGLISDEEGGVMQRSGGDPIGKVFYGYDKDHLYLGIQGSWSGEYGTLSVYFSLPEGEESNGFARGGMMDGERISFGFGLGSVASFFARPGTSGPLEFRTALGADRWSDPQETGKFARGKANLDAELMIPFSALEAGSLQPLRFSLTLEAKSSVLDVAPNRGGVEMVVPEQGDVTTLLSIDDPKGDDHGPGTYTYPTNPVFQPGVFDIKNLTVMEDPGGWIIFKLGFYGPVENPWGGRDGFSVQGIDIYLDTDGKAGSGSRDLFENRLARTTSGSEWEYFVRVCMDEVAIYGDPQTLLSDSEVLVRADPATSTITARVPVSVVGKPGPGWKIIVAGVSHEGLFSPGKVRAVLPTATEWEFGGGDGKGPNIIDLVVSGAESQEKILSGYKQTGSVAEIPGIALSR